MKTDVDLEIVVHDPGGRMEDDDWFEDTFDFTTERAAQGFARNVLTYAQRLYGKSKSRRG